MTIPTPTFSTFNSSRFLPFETRVKELSNLQDNWDGYGGFKPEVSALQRLEKLLMSLPKKYCEKLENDYIFPNPHGTLSVEWRIKKNIVSAELGKTSCSFYAVINRKETSEIDLQNLLSSHSFINALNSVTA